MTQPLRALLVSYAFPPVGGAGVQRVAKLVKYLPSHGVTPTVLTALNPSVPLRDDSLGRDVPTGTEVLRARTLEPGYSAKRAAWNAAAETSPNRIARGKKRAVEIGRRLLFPDAQVLWLPGAGRAVLRRAASSAADDVVFVSGPPFSQFLLAGLARRRPGVGVVLDYRDEWTTTQNLYEMAGSARAATALEKHVLRLAHAVTTATDAFRDELLARYPFLSSEHVRAIPNGYDPDDFPDPLPSPAAYPFRLTYAGTVFRLTSARWLLQGVRLLHEREPALAQHLELHFIGRVVETEERHFQGTEALGVRRFGYVDHTRAVVELARSHAALCLLEDVPGAHRIYPAKIFEIMHLRKPCLAVAPEGALADLVRRHRLGEVLPPGNPQAVCAALARTLTAFRDGRFGSQGDLAGPIGAEAFHRKRQAAEFAGVFRDAARRAREPTLRPT